MGSSHSTSSPKSLPSQSAPQNQPQQLQSSPPTPQTQKTKSSAKLPNIGKLNEQQLAAYEIPDAEEKKKHCDRKTKQYLFNQFQYQYASFYEERIKQNAICIDFKKRENLRILIIIGSSINNVRSKHCHGSYQKNSEDLSSALLIRHLFHNAFGIPYPQILITSTQQSDFYCSDINIDLISVPKTVFDENDDIDLFTEKVDFNFEIQNEDEFELNQSINLSQVKDQNYKFYMQEDLSSIIKPFNYYLIKNELKSNNNSHLLVFFIDHGHTGGFRENLPYQFFIERLMKIECKRFYVFNDSCCSGSLIKLIDICNDFIEIFPNIEDPILESALFFFLTNLNKVSPEFIKDAFDFKIEKINNIFESKINEKTKNELILKLKNLEDPVIEKINHFVTNLDAEFSSVGCVPHQFLLFSKKATIFTSSDYNQISLTLPGRKLDISAFNEPKIRVFGSVFTSILIESFLNERSQLSLENFLNNIKDLFQSYKEMFIDIIISQNEFINEKTENKFLPERSKIISFFSADPCCRTHYLNSANSDDWPDFNSIMLKEKYWNIDKSNVDTNEYENVFFCMFKKHNSDQLIENPHNFGPAKGSFYRDKFMEDYEYSVNLLLEKNNFDMSFSFNNLKSNERLIDSNYACYSQFISLIRPEINSHNWQVIQSLKYPMTLFINEKPNGIDEFAKLFAEAFKNVIIFWREYDL